jgi:hypothetical protein
LAEGAAIVAKMLKIVKTTGVVAADADNKTSNAVLGNKSGDEYANGLLRIKADYQCLNIVERINDAYRHQQSGP